MQEKKDVLLNRIINEKEYKQKKYLLSSLPQYLTIGMHYNCNAKCIFCAGGNYKSSFEKYVRFIEPKLEKPLKQASVIGFHGYGELFLMPQIEIFLEYINKKHAGKIKDLFTNGMALNSKILKKLAESEYQLSVSLHAVDGDTHSKLTGMKSYENIISNIKELVKVRNTLNPELSIHLMFVANKLNIDSLPEFIKLAAKLGVNSVKVSYMKVYRKKDLRLSCFYEKGKTIESFLKAETMSQKTGLALRLPYYFMKKYKKENVCDHPWVYSFIDANDGSVNACCFPGKSVGQIGTKTYESLWNSKGYRGLRKCLSDGTPDSQCRFCVYYDPNNINSIRSHVSLNIIDRKSILSDV